MRRSGHATWEAPGFGPGRALTLLNPGQGPRTRSEHGLRTMATLPWTMLDTIVPNYVN